jgi:hypothetical protein
MAGLAEFAGALILTLMLSRAALRWVRKPAGSSRLLITHGLVAVLAVSLGTLGFGDIAYSFWLYAPATAIWLAVDLFRARRGLPEVQSLTVPEGTWRK